MSTYLYARACVHVRVSTCVCVCVRARVCARVRARACVRVRARKPKISPHVYKALYQGSFLPFGGPVPVVEVEG